MILKKTFEKDVESQSEKHVIHIEFTPEELSALLWEDAEKNPKINQVGDVLADRFIKEAVE